ETAAAFDTPSRKMYERIFAPLLEHFEETLDDLLAPPLRVPRDPLAVMRFGLRALPSTLASARAWFGDEKARGLLAGNAAHSVVPLDRPLAPNAIGLMLMLAGHACGW